MFILLTFWKVTKYKKNEQTTRHTKSRNACLKKFSANLNADVHNNHAFSFPLPITILIYHDYVRL